MALITASDVKPILGVDANDTRLDAQLETWISEAESAINMWCNQPIAITTKTNYTFSGNGCYQVTLGFFPMASLTGLAYRSGVGSAATWTAIDTTTYELADNVILAGGGFTEGVHNYRATFTVGYASDAIPPDVQAVCVDMVTQRAYESNMPGLQASGRFGKSAITTTTQGSTVTQSFRDMLPRFRDALSHYQRMNRQ